MYDLRVIIIQDKTFTFPSQLSRRSAKQVEFSWNPLWIVSHPPPRRICTNLIPCLRYQNLMTFSKKSTDTRYIILLPVLPLHKLDTDIFQKIYLYPICISVNIWIFMTTLLQKFYCYSDCKYIQKIVCFENKYLSQLGTLEVPSVFDYDDI